MRSLALAAAALALLLHLVAGVGVWKAAREPSGNDGWIETRSGMLTARAELELRGALVTLSDRSLAPANRLEVYRGKLGESRLLLVRSLNVNPAQPDALVTLATVDYELAPTDRATRDQARERIETAARLAPRVPRVQAQLGELLLRMGYAEEALGYLARGAELDASLSDRVVRLAIAHGLTAETIREALPHDALTLAALRHAFGGGDFESYVVWIETAIDEGSIEPTHDLLWVYADAMLEIDQALRLTDHVDGWGPYKDDGVEASRQMQRARAALARGAPAESLGWAQASHALDPKSEKIIRFLGDIARAASRPELAVEAYRRGLGIMARRNAPPLQRAFFYRRIGEAQEELNRMDLAYEAYVRALELNPREPYARRRISVIVESDP